MHRKIHMNMNRFLNIDIYIQRFFELGFLLSSLYFNDYGD